MNAKRHAASLLLGVLLAACGSTPTPPTPAASPPAASTPGPTSTATPSATPSATSNPTMGWRAVPDQPALRRVGFTTIVRAEQRFVAVGTADDHVLFLDSDDGLTWHRGTDLGAEANVVALAAGPRGLVAVGTVDGRPASWVSEDGLFWTPRTEPFPMPALGTATATVTGVIANGDGWIAVGREDPACEYLCGWDPVRALVWKSRDGLAWTRVADQPALEGAGMDSIVRTDGGFVAGGIETHHAAVWTSADGRTWSRVADAPLFHPQPVFHPQPATEPWTAVAMSPIVAGHGVVVGFATASGVGDGGAPTAVAWWSEDGRTWAAVPVPDASPDDVHSLALTTDGFLATGSTAPGNRWHPIVWRSIDGRSWETVPAGSAPNGFDPAAVAASRTVEVAVGSGGVTVPAWWRPVP